MECGQSDTRKKGRYPQPAYYFALTETLFEPGDALHEVVEADPALFVAKSDSDRAEDAAVEAEAQRLQRRSKLVQVEVARPVHVNAFEHVL